MGGATMKVSLSPSPSFVSPLSSAANAKAFQPIMSSKDTRESLLADDTTTGHPSEPSGRGTGDANVDAPLPAAANGELGGDCGRSPDSGVLSEATEAGVGTGAYSSKSAKSWRQSDS